MVVKMVADKGFGFIKGDDGKEYFFHRTAAQTWDTMEASNTVTFTPTEGPKGLRAEDVRLV